MGQYISIHSGEVIDRVITAFIDNATSKRSIYSHAVNTEDWVGSDKPYTFSIELYGTYDIGKFPIVYFICDDENYPNYQNMRFDLDYKFTTEENLDNESVATHVTVFTNIKMKGYIIEVASLSGVNI